MNEQLRLGLTLRCCCRQQKGVIKRYQPLRDKSVVCVGLILEKCSHCTRPVGVFEDYDAEGNLMVRYRVSGKRLLRLVEGRELPLNIQQGIYFIQGKDTQKIKIGFSDNINNRIITLQSSSPDKLSLIGFIPGGGRIMEKELHKRFKAHCSHGEWFFPSPILLKYIGEVAIGYKV